MAIEILGLRKEQQARNTLREVLQTSDTRLLRETAELALARLGNGVGVPQLEKLMQSSTYPERQLFMAARLAEFGNPNGYKYVVQRASDRTAHLRYLAVGGLVAFLRLADRLEVTAIGPAESLITLLDDREPNVRQEVLIYLPSAISKGFSVRKARPIVEKMAKSELDPAVRELARIMLISWDEAPRQEQKK